MPASPSSIRLETVVPRDLADRFAAEAAAADRSIRAHLRHLIRQSLAAGTSASVAHDRGGTDRDAV